MAKNFVNDTAQKYNFLRAEGEENKNRPALAGHILDRVASIVSKLTQKPFFS